MSSVVTLAATDFGLIAVGYGVARFAFGLFLPPIDADLPLFFWHGWVDLGQVISGLLHRHHRRRIFNRVYRCPCRCHGRGGHHGDRDVWHRMGAFDSLACRIGAAGSFERLTGVTANGGSRGGDCPPRLA